MANQSKRLGRKLAALICVAACTREPAGEIAHLPARADPPAAVAAHVPPQPSPSRLLPAPEALADPVISAKIQASLLTDPAMGGADVSVNTSHGVVSLTGIVVSQEQAAIASAHAQGQDGVMRVDNHLAVNLH